MDDKTIRDGEKTKFIKKYKEQEVVEIYDR